MFCFAVVNRVTGEIEHCFVDNGANAKEVWEANIAKGLYPVEIDNYHEDLFDTTFDEEELIAILGVPDVDRLPNEPLDLMRALKYDDDPDDEISIDPQKIREEIKILPDASYRKGSINWDTPLKDKSSRKLIARSRRCKMNPVDGHIVEDMDNFENIVAVSNQRKKEDDDRFYRTQANGGIDPDVLETLKKQWKAEVKLDIARSMGVKALELEAMAELETTVKPTDEIQTDPIIESEVTK